MILAHYCMLFLVVFSLCFACFCLQLYSCYSIIFVAYCSIAVFLCNVDLHGGRGLGQFYIILGGLKYCYIMLHGGGGVKKSAFLCYIICVRPHNNTSQNRLSLSVRFFVNHVPGTLDLSCF